MHVEIKRKDLEPWLSRRAVELHLDLSVPAARALVETLGEEPGQLVGALQQLSRRRSRVGASRPAMVAQQFRGLGEQKVWDLCDRAFSRDLPGAIRSWRSIEEGGDDPLKVLGGVSSRLRDLIRVRALPDRMPPTELAKAGRAAVRLAGQALPAAGSQLLDGRSCSACTSASPRPTAP